MINFLWVFIGGGLGSICRYGIARVLENAAFTFPLATFLANAISCLILGVLLGLRLKGQLYPHHHLLLITGFCGGFSTFSTFTGETLHLLQNGNHLHAMANILMSLLLCLLCIYLGLKISSS